ncbi:MAG: peptide MFS transporter [Phaeodactylibacter sp.]|nr:peptide MFS transporter [Phaeodactylibacter sp.]
MAKADALGMDGQPRLLGHPAGLFVLFFTELWERFSYFGIRGILVLFLVAQTTGNNPGFGWSNQEALALYGWYTMLVYLAAIPGGILAARWLGQRRSVLAGGLILCLGYGLLVFDGAGAFYTGLTLVVLGVGCLKPNITGMVGALYSPDDDQRDIGFTIFYIGINVGAFLSTLVVGWVAVRIDWHLGFGLAGLGMLAGQAVYIFGGKYLKGVGEPPERNNPEGGAEPAGSAQARRTALLAVSAVILISVPFLLTGRPAAFFMVAFLGLIAGQAIAMYRESAPLERDRLQAVFFTLLLLVVFWGAFEQAGGLMNLFAQQKTDRMLAGFEVPAPWFQSLNPLYIILFGTPVGLAWLWWKRQGREASPLFKMGLGTIIMGLGFLFMTAASGEFEARGESAMYWLALAYLLLTLGELFASPAALSFITKLSPPRYSSMVVGFYFAAIGLGHKLAGTLGEAAQHLGDFAIFAGIAASCVAIGLLALLLLRPLKRLAHGAEGLPGSHFEEQEGFELADQPEAEEEWTEKKPGS